MASVTSMETAITQIFIYEIFKISKIKNKLVQYLLGKQNYNLTTFSSFGN
jgi:hypothetical protein